MKYLAVHTVSMVKNMVLAMDEAVANQLAMDANLAVTQMVCCMDDIGYRITGSMVALDRCVERADVLVVNRP